MRVLVTGGSGFLGSWIIHELCLRGIEPRVFDRQDDRRILRRLGAPADDLDWRLGDIAKPDDVEAAATGCDAAIHLAGLLMPACREHPLRGAEVNLLGTINLFEAARRQGLKSVVYSSTAGVFGPDDGQVPGPTTLYGAFKLACEGVARAYWHDHRLPSIGFRPFVIYGPGREIGASAGPTLACRAAARGKPYVIPYTGAAGLIYAADVAAIFCEALSGAAPGAGIYNLAGSVTQVDDVIAAIRQRIPDARLHAEGPPLPIAAYLDGALPSFAQSLSPTSLRDGIDATLSHYRT